MQTTWDLTPLYPSIESEAFLADLSAVQSSIQEMTAWSRTSFQGPDPTTDLCTYLTFCKETGSRFFRLKSYCNLLLSTDGLATAPGAALEKLEQLEALFAPIDTAAKAFLATVPDLDGLCKNQPLLLEHRFFLSQLQEEGRHLLSSQEETLYATLRSTGVLSFVKLWENTTAALEPVVNGKALPLAEVRNLAYHPDGALRKAAYEAEIAALQTAALSSAAALNAIKGETITLCHLRRYESPLAMTLIQSRLDGEVLSAMRQAMASARPAFRRYFKAKSKALGNKGALPFWDLFAPIGEENQTFPYAEAQDYVVKQFSTFSKALGDYARYAFDHRWVDALPKKGKRGGAFCENLHPIGESRVLTNFSGTFNDVLTLAHELGHGYHGACLKEESFLNSDYPMPIAETASTFCEILVKQAALATATPAQALSILESDVSDMAQILVDIDSRFLFEAGVFRARKNGPLSVEQLNDLMLSAQKETYGDGLSTYHPLMWVVKPHYYDADYHYYNFPYAYGLLFAQGLYGLYQQEKEAFPDRYRAMLSLTGKANLKDVAASMGIDITKPDFWHLSVSQCLQTVEQCTKALEAYQK